MDPERPIAPDFLELLPNRGLDHDGPVYHLWVFDPDTGEAHVEHNDDRHPADAITHAELAEQVKHPGRLHGYAYRIPGAWRITDDEHRAIDDPYIINKVLKVLRKSD